MSQRHNQRGPTPDTLQEVAVAAAVAAFQRGAARPPQVGDLPPLLDALFPAQAPHTRGKVKYMIDRAVQAGYLRWEQRNEKDRVLVLSFYQTEEIQLSGSEE